jgi:hypothetical protein
MRRCWKDTIEERCCNDREVAAGVGDGLNWVGERCIVSEDHEMAMELRNNQSWNVVEGRLRQSLVVEIGSGLDRCCE